MRKRFVILSVLAATFFACTSDSITNDNLDLINQEVKLKAAVERPFKIKKVEGTYSLSPGDGESCSALALNAIGEGTMTHLGRSTMLEEWCSNGPADLGTRTITLTAANGDELRGFHSSIEFTSPLSFVETLNFDGGTGRFENATGVFIETVVITPDFPGGPTGTFVMSGEGTITY